RMRDPRSAARGSLGLHQVKPENASLTGLGADIQPRAMSLDDPTGEIEADTQPRRPFVAALPPALKPLEDPIEVVLHDSPAAVQHLEPDPAGRRRRDGDLDRRPRIGVLRRVANQVPRHLPDALTV